jgi:hypothetical protein
MYLSLAAHYGLLQLSLSSQSQSSKENKEAQAKSNIQLSKNGGGTIRLKYTTGIRAILEDSKEYLVWKLQRRCMFAS